MLFTLIFYYLLSIIPVSDALLRGLENRFPMIESPPSGVKHVVVLGGGAINYFSQVPATSRLTSTSSARVLEAIRLFNQIDDGYLVFTGGAWGIDSKSESPSLFMKKLAMMLGVEEERIIQEPNPRDTHEEAIKITSLLKNEPFLLVTSAYHMPRAFYIFKKMGLNAIAAPCDFKAQGKNEIGFGSLLPYGFEESKIALKEYTGLLFYRLFK